MRRFLRYQRTPVPLLERRAGEHTPVSTPDDSGDHRPHRGQPRTPILVGEAFAPRHLLDVRARVEIVGIVERPADCASQCLAHECLPCPRHPTHDDDVRQPLLLGVHSCNVSDPRRGCDFCVPGEPMREPLPQNTMRALTVQPGTADSLQLEHFRVHGPDRGAVLIRALLLGVCGTDRELIAGQYGTAPPGHSRLIIGHESLGRVEDAPANSGLTPGDLVVPIVRHPDPVPCENCAAGEWDMCRNGRYTEHGIKAVDGFGCEWYRMDPQFVVRVDQSLGVLGVLVEPASIVAKAWEHAERIGRRALWQPRRALVTGGGPVGLLAALLGVQRGLEVHVFDRAIGGPKPELVRALGAVYHNGDLRNVPGAFDVIIECTAAPSIVADVVSHTTPDGIVCLAGVSVPGSLLSIDVGAMARDVVLGNRVVFGSVNANRRHYEAAVRALAAADAPWLERLITRRVSIDRFRDAFVRVKHDVKTVIELAGVSSATSA